MKRLMYMHAKQSVFSGQQQMDLTFLFCNKGKYTLLITCLTCICDFKIEAQHFVDRHKEMQYCHDIGLRLLKQACPGTYSWMEKNGQITQIERVIKKKMTSRSARQPRKPISIITPVNPEATPKTPIQLLQKSAKKPDAAGAGKISSTN